MLTKSGRFLESEQAESNKAQAAMAMAGNKGLLISLHSTAIRSLRQGVVERECEAGGFGGGKMREPVTKAVKTKRIQPQMDRMDADPDRN